MVNDSGSFAAKVGVVKQQAARRVVRRWSPVLGVLTVAGLGLWWTRRRWVDAVFTDASLASTEWEVYDTTFAIGSYTLADGSGGHFLHFLVSLLTSNDGSQIKFL